MNVVSPAMNLPTSSFGVVPASSAAAFTKFWKICFHTHHSLYALANGVMPFASSLAIASTISEVVFGTAVMPASSSSALLYTMFIRLPLTGNPRTLPSEELMLILTASVIAAASGSFVKSALYSANVSMSPPAVVWNTSGVLPAAIFDFNTVL
ncbi:hypothetical protein D3C78_1383230 [compost metagenome]